MKKRITEDWKKTEWWKVMIKENIDAESLYDLVDREIKGIFETKKLIN